MVKEAKEGNSESTKKLIDRYKFLIIKESGKYHIPSYDFEDLIQHGYLSVIKAIQKYTLGRNSFDGYAINSIRTNYKDLLKGKIKHYREVPDNSLLDANVVDYEFSIEDEVIAYEEVKKLYRSMEKLTTEQREIIERFYIKEESLREIACDINREYFSVYREKERALKILRKYL